MKDVKQTVKHSYPGTVVSYKIGFVSSLILTLVAYLTVTERWVEDIGLALAIIMGLAVVQLIVQLVFFLHLGREEKPRWNLAAFAFMVIMISIIAGGSLWIMDNLNYNMMMTPEEMNQYMLEESNKGF